MIDFKGQGKYSITASKKDLSLSSSEETLQNAELANSYCEKMDKVACVITADGIFERVVTADGIFKTGTKVGDVNVGEVQIM